jgi:hypothetical protein
MVKLQVCIDITIEVAIVLYIKTCGNALLFAHHKLSWRKKLWRKTRTSQKINICRVLHEGLLCTLDVPCHSYLYVNRCFYCIIRWRSRLIRNKQLH